MSGELMLRLQELYIAAMERPESERAQFVALSCGDDAELLRRLGRMVADAGEAQMFMEDAMPAASGIADDGQDGEDPLIGQRVGRYRVLRIIGAGGMGVVYEAQQDSPSRTVALKLLRPGWVSRSLLRRFEQEAEVLGRLSHPGIAHIHEAGSVEIGGLRQPFFAMEFVEGRSITRYVAETGLGARQRLELMAMVCDAMEHAHRKGVIHRDLKPGNVLVDGQGQPKVLDFGVARATNADIVSTTIRTHAGQIVGTIAYMSPEQARGSAAELDARSDVYSLGVMLFELLAGRLPHDIVGKPVPEAVRAITEDDPSHLSTIDRSLRGDIETIVAKALEKDKARRYQSAAELAADLRRHLSDQPITARPASTFYQARKFAARNKGLVTGVVAAFVVLTIALIGVSVQAARIQRAKVRAEEAAWFMESVLAASDPFPTADGANLPRNFGANARLIDVLDDVLHRLDERGLRDPVAEAKIRQMMSMSFFGVGRFEDGADNARRAIELLNGAGGSNDKLMLACKVGLAYNLAMLMDCDEAERVATEAVEGSVRVYGEHHEETLRALHCQWLCYLYTGYQDDCARVCARMLEIVRTSPRPLNYAAFSIKAELAANLVAVRRPIAGRALAMEALAESDASGDDRTHWVAFARIVLARAEAQLGDLPEAEAQARRSLEIWQAAAGGPSALEFQAELGIFVSAQPGRRDEGLAIISDAVASAREELGADAPKTARVTNTLAARLWDFRLLEEAEEQFREYFAIIDRAGGIRTMETAWTNLEFALVLLAQAREAATEGEGLTEQGRSVEAEDRLAVARAKFTEGESRLREGSRIAEGFTRTQWVRNWWDDRLLLATLVSLLHEQERDLEAEPLLALLTQRLDEPSDPEHANTIAWAMFEVGRPDLCEPLARRAVDDWRRLREQGEGPYIRSFVNTIDTWAAALHALDRPEEAEAAWSEGQAAATGEPGPTLWYASIAIRHAECLTDLERFDQAETILLRTLAELRGSTEPNPELDRAAFLATAAMYEAWDKPERAAEHTGAAPCAVP